jgi:hypothetical protein
MDASSSSIGFIPYTLSLVSEACQLQCGLDVLALVCNVPREGCLVLVLLKRANRRARPRLQKLSVQLFELVSLLPLPRLLLSSLRWLRCRQLHFAFL